MEDIIEEEKIHNLHADWIWDIIILPENIVATVSSDTKIKVWDINSFECKLTITSHKKEVY